MGSPDRRIAAIAAKAADTHSRGEDRRAALAKALAQASHSGPREPAAHRAARSRWLARLQTRVSELAARAGTDAPAPGSQLDRPTLRVVAALGAEDGVAPAPARDRTAPRGPPDVVDEAAGVTAVEDCRRPDRAP